MDNPNKKPDLNPAQADYEKKFNGIKDAEKAGTTGNKPQGVGEGEQNPDGGWENNYSKEGSQNGKSGGIPGSNLTFKGMLKKKGPLTAIILTIGGGGVGLAGLLSPGLLIVHMKEVMVDKFNTQLASMDIRTTKILSKKMGKNMTSGICTSVVSIKCRYSTMSNKQLAKFKAAGIEVEADSKNLLGRNKPTKIMFDGKEILPENIASEFRNNPAFRAATKKAYNPKWAGFWDKIGNKALFNIKVSKKGISFKKGSTDAEKLTEIQTSTKNGSSDPNLGTSNGDAPVKKTGETDAEFGARKADYDKALTKGTTEIADGASEVAESGVKAATKVAKGIGNMFKITGVADQICMVYGTLRAVGFAAKTVRAAQLARFVMLFWVLADQIKGGGNPKSEDVAYLGSILTADVANTVKTNGGAEKMVKKTATESFGYNYAIGGKKNAGPMGDAAMQFLAGGGVTGQLIGLTTQFDRLLGGSPKNVCKFLNNVFVQIGSAIAGVAVGVLSGGVTVTAGMVAQGIGMAALGFGVTLLPALLKDMVAGVVVDSNTIGENAGDAMASGAGASMGTMASTGGNVPLSPTQAVAYQGLTSETLAMYAEEDRATLSPFDTSNKNTFLGSILFKATPLIAKMASPSGMLTSMASLVSGSLSSIAPVTYAADAEDYTMCEDMDYKDMGLAADPFCNLVYGVPTDKLNIDPDTVADKMANQIDVNPTTGEVTPREGSGYKKYLDECTNRANPIGWTGEDFQGDNGSGCIISDSNDIAYYSLFQIDQRVETGMSGEDSDLENGSVGTTTTDTSESSGVTELDPTEVPDGSAAQPPNTEERNSGWTFKDGQNYSTYSCADESNENRVVENKKGTTIRTCDTALGEVASVISQRVVNMVAAAKKAGVILQGGGFRTYDEQIAARKRNCPTYREYENAQGETIRTNKKDDGTSMCTDDEIMTKSASWFAPDTAIPGTSMHESGLAVDFTSKSTGKTIKDGSVEQKWLITNGTRFGFHKLASESWHFSMSGG